MRGRVVGFAAVCTVVAIALIWLALGGEPEPASELPSEIPPAARKIEPAPEIRAERPAPAPAPEARAEVSPDDDPVIEVLDVLQALAERPEESE